MRRLPLVLLAVTAVSCECGRNPGVMMNNPVAQLEVTELDFGAVQEFTTAQKSLPIRNLGRVPLTVSVSVASGSSDFTIDTPTLEVEADGTGQIQVTFAPMGAGSDQATLDIATNDPDSAVLHATLKGGPIFPTLSFVPDPLDFRPASMPLVTKSAVIKNVGLATLHVNAVGVDVNGNPDFSVTAPSLPLVLRPGAMSSVDVAYARSPRAEEGRMQADSDDPDAGSALLRLIPDPPAACADGLDNDNDGLIDFPDDIGCIDAQDSNESNPPQCVNGASQPCGSSTGVCTQGVRFCANSIWGGCDGGVRASTETCNGSDDDCNGVSDDGVSETCSVFGCAGARACLPDAGVDGGLWTQCLPIAATNEVCDGIDNNCNGSTDEGVVRTCAVNTCTGIQVCIPDGGGAFTACVAANPLAETCNGLDDDCNGSIDDGLPDLNCGLGQCRRTAAACVNGDAGVCVPGMPSMEMCNGADDDCNGALDDGLGNTSCGVGACARSVAACVLGGPGVCTPGNPMTETCNGIDDDCNGVSDDGLGNLTCGVGACFRSVAACSGGSAGSCVAGNPTAESCNLVDDNCDGTVDNMPNLMCGVGQCARTAAACTGGVAGTCTPGNPVAESCNGLDDNCNSATDEQSDGGALTQTCYTGPGGTLNVGRCRAGTQTCSGGMFGAACNGQVVPAATETCANTIDDNCNNQVDEGCDGGACDNTGTWRVNGSAIAYSCTFGIVNVSISQVVMANNVPAAGQMRWTPQPTWSPGASRLLVGTLSSCPSGMVTVTRVYSGTCTETYTITGSFTGPDSFSGTMTMSYASTGGSCFDCTNQSFPINLVRP
ncbi:MAG: MopE-related protein [Archangium sp.]